MNLLYDLIASQPGKSAKFHGGGLYSEVIFFSLIENLEEIDLLCVYDSKRYINPEIEKKCNQKNIKLIDINISNITDLIRDNNIDVFYSALPEIYHKYKIDDCLFVGTIHGPRSLEMYIDHTAWYYAKTIKEKVIVLSRILLKKQLIKYRVLKIWGKLFYNPNFKFITVSEHSRFSVSAFFPTINSKNVKVFYSPQMNQLEDYVNLVAALPESLEPQKYFLMSSGERWLKNNLRAVRALDELFTENPNWIFKAAITGVRTKSIFLKHIKNKDRFVFFDFIDRELLETLHKDAYAFIYPTLNEGFGYPPLDSMKYKVPVVASGISSIPEICGDGVIYFNPFCTKEIKNRILQVLDSEIYNTFSKKGYERYLLINERQKNDLRDFIQYLRQIKKGCESGIVH